MTIASVSQSLSVIMKPLFNLRLKLQRTHKTVVLFPMKFKIFVWNSQKPIEESRPVQRHFSSQAPVAQPVTDMLIMFDNIVHYSEKVSTSHVSHLKNLFKILYNTLLLLTTLSPHGFWECITVWFLEGVFDKEKAKCQTSLACLRIIRSGKQILKLYEAPRCCIVAILKTWCKVDVEDAVLVFIFIAINSFRIKCEVDERKFEI